MSVFIRKLLDGGVTLTQTDTSSTDQNKDFSAQAPKFSIGQYQVNLNNFVGDLNNNFQTFYDVYEGTWTEQEKRDVLREHQLFLLNLLAGNITGIDSAGRFNVVNPSYSGIDFNNPSWGIYSYYVKRISDLYKSGLDNESSKSKKTFTNTSILRDIHNKFFGGTENPDYRAFFDLDEVVTNSDGKKVRGVKNRVNALLDLLNENYLSQYDSVDESLGGMDEVRKRIDRLRFALADGTLNNEDYASAAALGLNLRGLLSTDGNLLFDSNGGFASSGDSSSESSSDSSTTKSAADQLKEMVYGPTTTAEDLLNKMKSWNGSVNVEYNVGPLSNFSATEYLQERMSARNESLNGTAEYYRKEFYPKFFENLKTYTPEYLKQNGKNTVKTWRGDETLNDYVKTNLTLAIRNKLYGQSSLLSDNVSNELNQIVGTDFWTVPKSFDENTGTVLLFNPNTGAYKRVSILDRNLKFISTADGKAHSLIEDYVYGTQLQVASAKKGAKLLLGGNINGLALSTLSDDLKNEAFSALFQGDALQQQLLLSQATSTEPAKKYHTSDKIIGEDSADWETEDYARLVSLGADMVSLAGGWVGLGAGLVSTVSDAVADISDESLSAGDVGKNIGTNLAWTIAGLVPTAKLGKIGKGLLKWGPRGLALLDSYGLIKDLRTYDSLHRIFTTGEVTSDDLNLITQLGRAITGGIGMGKAMKREHVYARGRTETTNKNIKVTRTEESGEKRHFNVELTKDEISRINKSGQERGLKSANEELLKILREKGVSEEASKKTTLKTDVFGDGTSRLAKLKRSNKKISTDPVYSLAHHDYIHEKYGKWMGIENEGEGFGLPSLGIKNGYRRAKGFVLGDSEYDNYIRDHSESSSSARTSETSGSSARSAGEASTGEASTGEASRTGASAETPRAETPRTEESATETPRAEVPGTEIPDSKIKIPAPAREEPKAKESKVEVERKEAKTRKQQQHLKNLEERQKREIDSSSARENTNKNTRRIIKDRNYYYNLAKGLPSSKEKTDLITYLDSFKGKKKRNKGGTYGKFNSDKAERIIEPLKRREIQLNIPGFKKGSKLYQIIELKKSGGILKGQTGLTFEDYKKLYLQQELGNKYLKPYNTIANTSVLNDHNSDFTLQTAYNKNTAYTGNRNLVGQDLLNYLNSRKYNTIEDFIANYNRDAEKIRNFWTLEHKANTEKGENVRSHNTLFREMFKNRSDASNNNPSYNIGYDDKIEDIMGSSTWMRRMDRYASKFDINNPDVSRIHKITLPNGDYGYVYKEQDGSIGLIDKALGDKLISQISQGNPQASGNPQTTSGLNPNNGNNYVWGVGDGNDYNWQLGGIQGGITGVGSRKNIDLYKYLPATLAFGRMVGDIDSTNRRVKRYLGSLQVPVQTPYEFHRQIYGDYGSLKQADDLAALVRSQMNRPTTSNATLAALQRLEGEKLAAEQQWKGHLADNQMIHKTYEQSAAEEKENIKRRTDAANTNRGLFAEDARLRANAIASADAANRNSYDAWQMAYIEKPIAEEANRRKAYQEWYDYASIGPMEYDFRGDPYLLDAQRRLSETTDEKTRAAILRDAENYRISKAASYKIAQLKKFRLLNPYIQQRIPFDDSNLYHVLLAKKGGSVDIYGSALLKAKSKDNDRLIKQVLDVIKNHKDLVKGVRTPDYSKYIIRNLR